MTKAILEVVGIQKNFGGNKVLDDVEFSIEKGSIVGLIGPNGAGKTTLVNIISGLINQDKGHIYFMGKHIDQYRSHQRAVLGIRRTFQAERIFSDISVLKNIITASHTQGSCGLVSILFNIKKFKKEELRLAKKALTIAEKTGLREYANDRAGSLSYGYQRKVDIARALASDPKLLILDEPTAGLNMIESNNLMEFMQGLISDGMTLLIIEHNMKVVMSICEKIVVLNFGKKIAEGTPESIQTNELVISSYLGIEENQC